MARDLFEVLFMVKTKTVTTFGRAGLKPGSIPTTMFPPKWLLLGPYMGEAHLCCLRGTHFLLRWKK